MSILHARVSQYCFVLIFLIQASCLFSSCNKTSSSDNTTTTTPPTTPPVIPPVTPPVVVDTAISKYADEDPLNDVTIQGFWWDIYNDSKSKSVGSVYEFLSSKVVELTTNHFDLMWLPPPSEGEGMGYHPRKLLDFNSNHGTEAQLIALLNKMKQRKMHPMADLVLNHRIGTFNWNDFTSPEWDCSAIVINDEGYTNPNAVGTKPCGDREEAYPPGMGLDTSMGWGGARDLNHQSPIVQAGIINYLSKLKQLGFDSWRYDFVKGFPPKYVGLYNQSSNPYLSVGEFWDGNTSYVKNWVTATGYLPNGTTTNPSTAFDFPLKYNLKNAVVNNRYDQLNLGGSINGLVGVNGYAAKAVTFLDNHDMACVNRTDCNGNDFSTNTSQITVGYAFILTHPGIPMVWIYHYYYQDPTGTLKKDINELIAIRKSNGINANSQVNILKSEIGLWVSVVDNKVLVKMGFQSYQPSSEWKLAKSGTDYAVYTK